MDSNLRSNVQPISRLTSCGVACVLLAACAVSSACATAINGTTQRVAVASDPPGAQVYVNDAPVGVTPAFVDLPRRDRDLELRLEKDGYEPAKLEVERELSGWSWGNLLFAGVPINDYGVGQWVGAMALYGALGWLRDARSGGAYKRPGLLRANLAPVRAANDATTKGRRVSPPPASASGAPGTAGPQPRNRLAPMQLADRVNRLTGWEAEPDRRPKPMRP